VRGLGEAVEKHSPLNAEADPGETPEPRGKPRDASEIRVTGGSGGFLALVVRRAADSSRVTGQPSNRHVGLRAKRGPSISYMGGPRNYCAVMTQIIDGASTNCAQRVTPCAMADDN